MKKIIKTMLLACAAATVVCLPAAASEGKSITVASDTSIETMDSSLAKVLDAINVIGNVQEGLYIMGEDNVPIPALATDMEISDDGLTYTFTLRDDAVWSNGTPVTANDFVYAWRRLADPNTASENEWMMELVGVKNCSAINKGELEPEELGVEAPDDTTFVVTLDQPCVYFTAVTCFNSFYPLNEEFVESRGDSYALTADDLIFNGPYVVKSWDVGGDTITIEKNETYYDADSVDIEEITFRVITDKQEAVMAFENGEIDYTTINGTLAEMYRDSEHYQEVLTGNTTMLMCNFESEAMSNQNLRMAIGYAVDREVLTASVLMDGSQPIGGVVGAGLSSNDEGVDYRDYAGSFMGTDKELAAEYWEKAQEETDVRNVTLLYTDTETNAKLAAYIQSEVEGTLEGLSMELQAVPNKTRIEMLGTGDYEICLQSWGPDYADPVTILSLYDPRNTNPNYSRWTSDEFLANLELSNSVEYLTDTEGRWELLKAMEEDIVTQGASLPLYQKGYAILMRNNIKNAHYNVCGTSFNYKFAYIEE